jgi:short-subunit dehydrogenase involved in D-alanine esterification of teichoic acids
LGTGSGDVRRRLADGFIELGNTVKIGSRDPNQQKKHSGLPNTKSEKHHQEHLQKQHRLVNWMYLRRYWLELPTPQKWLIKRILLEKL